MKYGVKNFITIADAYVNAKTNTLDGLERSLQAWFCFTFNTTLNDSRLLDMTLEDLMVLYHMHQVRDNPAILSEVDGNSDSYEEWLKREMGESYVSQEDMVEEMLEYERQEELEAQGLPDVITTDFSAISEAESE